jgi:hypothetical protein
MNYPIDLITALLGSESISRVVQKGILGILLIQRINSQGIEYILTTPTSNDTSMWCCYFGFVNESQVTIIRTELHDRPLHCKDCGAYRTREFLQFLHFFTAQGMQILPSWHSFKIEINNPSYYHASREYNCHADKDEQFLTIDIKIDENEYSPPTGNSYELMINPFRLITKYI